jgi:N-acetyltransferase
VVGSTRFGNYDPSNRRIEIGWTWLARPWQRTAINTEAKYLMLTHAFEKLHCVRVELKTDVLNTPSRKAMLRIGAKEEGILRKHTVMWTGRYRDSIYYSILDEEWPDVKEQLERMLVRRPGPAAVDQA